MTALYFAVLAQNYSCLRIVSYFSGKILLRALIPKLTKVKRGGGSLSKKPRFPRFCRFLRFSWFSWFFLVFLVFCAFLGFLDFCDFSQFSDQISKNAPIWEIALGIGRKKWQKRNVAEVAKSRDSARESANFKKTGGHSPGINANRARAAAGNIP